MIRADSIIFHASVIIHEDPSDAFRSSTFRYGACSLHPTADFESRYFRQLKCFVIVHAHSHNEIFRIPVFETVKIR